MLRDQRPETRNNEARLSLVGLDPVTCVDEHDCDVPARHRGGNNLAGNSDRQTQWRGAMPSVLCDRPVSGAASREIVPVLEALKVVKVGVGQRSGSARQTWSVFVVIFSASRVRPFSTERCLAWSPRAERWE